MNKKVELEKVSSEIASDIIPLNDEEFRYDYQRVSAYDPNMCSTAARFSPEYRNRQGPGSIETATSKSKIIANPYKNDILVECDENSTTKRHAHHGSQLVNQLNFYQRQQTDNVGSFINYNANIMIKHIEGSNVDFHQSQQQHEHLYCEEIIGNGRNIDFIKENEIINETTAEHKIPTQISIQQSPNGHIYENYYLPNDHNEEMVELVQIAAEENENVIYNLRQHEQQANTSAQYDYHNEIVTNSELIPQNNDLIDHLNVQLRNDNSYLQSYSNDDRHQIISEKDQQRILLERTMSPLLAAVNDIAQREAELESYLKPNLQSSQMHKSYTGSSYYRKKGIPKYSSDEDDDYLIIADKPVESRSIASLPTNYLQFHYYDSNLKENPTVIAKKEIQYRTKFGPIEGDVRFTSDVMLDVLRVQTPRFYPLLLIGETRMLETSNENTSNWMKYVRLAQNYTEQNLYLVEENGKLYFKCCQNIQPQEELKVGYSKSYAGYYGLQVLTVLEENKPKLSKKKYQWSCFECDKKFITSKKLQDHLGTHDADENLPLPLPLPVQRKSRIKSKPVKRVMEIQNNSNQCFYCLKVFATSVTLKCHLETHFVEKSPIKSNNKSEDTTEKLIFKCNYCRKQFNLEKKLKNHLLLHLKDEKKPYECKQCNRYCATPTALASHIRSHTNRFYTCIYCNTKFKHVGKFRSHVQEHSENGVYYCHYCHKKYKGYHLVRKHFRIFHRSVQYPCNECDRKFKHISFLRRHKDTHLNIKNFLCAECGRQFRRKDKLKDHMKKFHSVLSKKKTKRNLKLLTTTNNASQCLPNLNKKLKKNNSRSRERNNLNVEKKGTENPQNCVLKCDECGLGFKRRGMLINHIAKRHPDIQIDSIHELNLPVLKPTALFFCIYCAKVYKSNAKRKMHILKNHPGKEMPPTLRGNDPALVNMKTIGSFEADVQKCESCYKQYTSRTRLLAHYRKEHPDAVPPGRPGPGVNDRYHDAPSPSKLYTSMERNSLRTVSPENKLLKLSSVLEDRNFFDFLNERSDNNPNIDNDNNVSLTTPESQNSIYSKVDCNYKIVDGESSSNSDLNRLFDESIGCI